MTGRTEGLNAVSRILVLAVIALGCSISAFAVSRVECSRVNSKILKREVPYCAMLPPSYDEQKTRQYPVVYYLHGLGDNEQSVINAGGWNKYEDLLEQGKVGEFLIITPYGYQSFYINSADGKMRYEDFFLREFLPAMQKKYRMKPGRASRGITGISMGGYGALHYAFKYPEMFAAVSTHMAALRETVDANVGSTPEGKLLGDVFGNPINKKYYDTNNPLTLARKKPAAQLRRLKIYFDCGAQDNYGFNVGAEQLHTILQKRGIPHEWHIYPGGHNWDYVLAHFEASMVWQSRALGLTK